MKRKVMAGIICAAMAGSMIAGCGGSSSSSSGSAASSTGGSTASSTEAATETAASSESVSGTTASSVSSGSTEAPSNPYEGIKANENYDFQVIVKSFSATYWEAVMEGANAAADELGVTVSNQGPNAESDTADQVNMLNTAISNKPDGIGIAASDADSVTDSLEEAKEAGVPLIAFDSDIPNAPEGSVSATIATDQYAAGEIAGKEMWKAIKDKVSSMDKARVGYVGQDTVSGAHQGRGTGFIDALCEAAKADGVETAVIGNDYFVNAAKDKGDESSAKLIIEVRVPSQVTADLCQAEAIALLNKDDTVGLFATGQVDSEALVSANQNLNKLSNNAENGVIAIGFDSGAIVKDSIASGVMYDAVTQTPYLMGYYTVYALTALANGEEVSDYSCPAYFYTADNMDDDIIASNLYD